MFIDRDVLIRVSPEKFQNDVYDIVNLFYKGFILRSGGSPVRGAGGGADAAPDYICVTQSGGSCAVKTVYSRPGESGAGDTVDFNFNGYTTRAYQIKTALYGLLKARASLELGKTASLPWGSLVGIRPVKIYADLAAGCLPPSDIVSKMSRDYDVPEKSSALCLGILDTQRGILNKYDARTDYMLYAGIPFCATKCAYCSFPSDAHNKPGKYAALYVDALLKEIYFIAGFMKNAGKKLKAAYIGGGTPTALPAEELKRFLYGLSEAFGGEYPDELTVEAGRADTVDDEKLGAILPLRHIAGRIRLCVNPQTMNRRTLELVGRAHTPEDVEKVYYMARESGFNEINMDIIAGLPGEDSADFMNTLEKVFGLKPESVTSHTLCIKRSSRFNEFQNRYAYPDAAEVGAMQEAAFASAAAGGMRPYYLYRQKNTIGGLANIGYAVNGCECVYNIHEMADRIDVLAAGAGAVSKFIRGGEGRVERVFNVKNLLEYISRIDEMIDRKKMFFEASRDGRPEGM